MGRYSGAWAKRSGPTLAVPLKPPVDPEHLAPTANPQTPPGQSQLWQSNAFAPSLPVELVDAAPPPSTAPGGPIDSTPADHSYGMGVGAGLTVQQAQDLRGYWHSRDDGSVATHAWEPNTDRDGTWNLAYIPDTINDGDSPGMVEYERYGVGTRLDTTSRLGGRFKRWVDRIIDMHRYEVRYRPMYVRTAKNQGSVAPVAGGGQLDSPYATNTGAQLASPDQFVTSVERRTPTPWDQPWTREGNPSPYGLNTVWGL